ncbi:hypothetical protein BKA80DRAFT_273160 [Phyllosticta citrichinensis]
MIAPLAAWPTGVRDALIHPLPACEMLSRAACVLPIAVLRDDHGNTVAGVYSHAIRSILCLPLRRCLQRWHRVLGRWMGGSSSPVRIENRDGHCKGIHHRAAQARAGTLLFVHRGLTMACVIQLSNVDTGLSFCESFRQPENIFSSWQLAGLDHLPLSTDTNGGWMITQFWCHTWSSVFCPVIFPRPAVNAYL